MNKIESIYLVLMPKSQRVKLILCPAGTVMTQGASMEPHPLSSATRLEMKPRDKEVSIMGDDLHSSLGPCRTGMTQKREKNETKVQSRLTKVHMTGRYYIRKNAITLSM